MDFYSDIHFVAADILPNCLLRINTRYADFYNLHFLLRGRMEFGIDEKPRLVLSQPSLFWHHPRHSYQYGPVDADGWHHFWVSFRGPRAQRIMERGFMPLSPKGYLPIRQTMQMQDEFGGLIELVRRNKSHEHPRAVALLESILAVAWEDRHGGQERVHPEYKVIADAVTYLQKNLYVEPDWDELSQRAGMSYSKFRRLFRELEKESPHGYFLRCRMRVAAELLRNSSLTVKDVAYRFGYDDVAQFSKLFKQKIGLPPGQFRGRLLETASGEAAAVALAHSSTSGRINLDARAPLDDSSRGYPYASYMKRSTFLRLILGGVGSLGLNDRALQAASLPAPEPIHPPPPARDRSLQLEIEHAIEKGLYSLVGQQKPAGFWSTMDTPGPTGLVLTAFVKEPTGLVRAHPPEFINKGYDFLLQCQQPDGGIYLKGLANYSTAIAILALMAADPEAYASVIQRARIFLVGQQANFPPGSEGDSYNGGIGYGDKSLSFDVSNTSFALEALRETRAMADSHTMAGRDLDWNAAVNFFQRCQNLPSHNPQSWVKGDQKNLGGFVYDPLNRKNLLSYGSISYAGLLSYIHADLKKDDPRVSAVHNWLRQNYTLEENPGMGSDGLYYYYHMMAKSLSAFGEETLTLADGKQVVWSSELALKLINLQQADGSWVNTSGRWWEKDPVLVTSYAVRALEILHSQV
ncbi:MAG: helix-turn-helix domain-containing protein [Methylacidiphilales bacterium]|nr:helix-turn-helix domain-containing protein [Candidatus Methylacidiphilales bacterium]